MRSVKKIQKRKIKGRYELIPKDGFLSERCEMPDTQNNLLATLLLLLIFQEQCSDGFGEKQLKNETNRSISRTETDLWANDFLFIRTVGGWSHSGHWGMTQMGGRVELSGCCWCPRVDLCPTRRKEPVNADSPEAGAFPRGEYWMGLVCKSNVCIKDIQAFIAPRD